MVWPGWEADTSSELRPELREADAGRMKDRQWAPGVQGGPFKGPLVTRPGGEEAVCGAGGGSQRLEDSTEALRGGRRR